MNPRIPGNEIVREARGSGQGIIFQSLQKSANRKVVVKVLIAGALADEKTLERFRREIDAFAGLRHPCFVMDFVDGSRLNDHVASRKLDMRQFLGLIANICEGVYEARQRGIIHRDLKPANIIVDADGRPRIRWTPERSEVAQTRIQEPLRTVCRLIGLDSRSTIANEAQCNRDSIDPVMKC